MAIVIGFFGTPGGEPYHWFTVLTMALFIIGALCSAVTLILVTGVTVKEAHGMETALHKFSKGEITREEVMFNLENETLHLANSASGFGLVSAIIFAVGCAAGIVQIALFL